MAGGNLVGILYQKMDPHDGHQGGYHVPGPLGQVTAGLAAGSQGITHVDQHVKGDDCDYRRVSNEDCRPPGMCTRRH